MRWISRPLEGDAETFDGTNADVIEAFAPGQFEGTDEAGRPHVRGTDGVLAVMEPGWTISRADGSAGAVVSSPAAWADRWEELPGRS